MREIISETLENLKKIKSIDIDEKTNLDKIISRSVGLHKFTDLNIIISESE